MVWGVSLYRSHWPGLLLKGLQWAVASLFIVVVGMAMAELASAAPTSGGVRVMPRIASASKGLTEPKNLSRDHSFIFGRTLILPPNGAISSPGLLAVGHFLLLKSRPSHSTWS